MNGRQFHKVTRMYSLFLMCIIYMSVFDCTSSQDIDDLALIILTLSPLQETETTREIGVYYYCPDCTSEDTLVVSDVSPTGDQESHAFRGSIAGVSGFMKTGLWGSAKTFSNFSAAILRNEKLVHSNAVIDRTNWMQDNKSVLKRLSLAQLLIPGTHQSGAYERPDSVAKWNLCQDMSIEEQLDLGIRYLDIQPACNRVAGQCESFYVEYSLVEIMSMDEVFSDIKAFMDRTKEIVILSFSDFTSDFQSDEDHERFMNYIKENLADLLYPFNTDSLGWSTPLKKFWSRDRRLVVSYNYKGPVDPVMWRGLEQNWCNCQRLEDLHGFLSDPDKRELWSSRISPNAEVVQLTPSWEMIVPDSDEEMTTTPWSNRAWTDEFSPNLFQWYHEEWNGSSNIVIVDFFEATGIVDLAIYWNQKRGEERRSSTGKN